MNDSNATEIEQGIGNEVDHFVVRGAKKESRCNGTAWETVC